MRRGAHGLDEVLADEREKPLFELRSLLGCEELGDRGTLECSSFDRRSLEHRALARAQPIDAGGEERVDARRHDDASALRLEGDELLEEKRVALRGLDRAGPCLL